MSCLRHSVLQRMHSPVKHSASLFYIWCDTEMCTWGTGKLCRWAWDSQSCSADDGSRGLPRGMSRRQQSLAQQEHVGRCFWLCKTCIGDDGPLAQVLKAGCSSPLTFENWRLLLCLKETASPYFILGRVRTDGKECACLQKRICFLLHYYCGQIEAAKSAALEKTSTLCCREC